MKEYGKLFTPVLLHLVILELAGAAFRGVLDSASATSLAALAVIPFAWYLMRQDHLAAGSRDGLSVMDQALRAVLCMAGGAAMNLLLSRVMNLMDLQSVFSNEAQENLLSSAFAAQWIGLGVLVPIAEEMIFRGLTYRRMRKLFGWVPAVIFSAALFAVYHGNPIQMLFAFPMALLLALLEEKGGSLWYPVLFHMGSNLFAVTVGFLS